MQIINNKIRKSKIGTCNIDQISRREVVCQASQWIENKKMHNYIISINLAKICMIQKDKKLNSCVHNSAINIADGISILIATKLLGDPISERITGIELMEDLLKIANEKKYRVYFLGAKDETLMHIITKCQINYPDMQIAGYHNGYFNDSEIPEIIKAINISNSNILFVGMGLPQKEYFVYDYHSMINCPVILPVGGGFDVLAGLKKRAPKFVQKIGAEWLWRSFYDRSRFFLILKNLFTFANIIKHQMADNKRL